MRSSPVSTRLFALALFALLLAGCTAPIVRPLPADREAAWQSHRDLLGAITGWHLMASLAVRAGKEGGQANMDWHQGAAHYEIRLTGPLGSGAVELTGNGAGATLVLANGTRLSDADPALLLYDQLGWWIPVESLRYWAVGLPDPALPSSWEIDEYGRLASLQQNGWKVRFDSYRPAGNLDMPERIVISGHDAEVRMVARRWTIDVAEAR